MPTGYPGRTHGNVGTYINGCRCDDCRLGASRYYHRRTREEYLALIEAQHGTERRAKRCGCDDCRAAATKARRERRERNRAADNAYQREYKRRRRAATSQSVPDPNSTAHTPEPAAPHRQAEATGSNPTGG